MSWLSLIGLVLLAALVVAELWRLHLVFWHGRLDVPMTYHDEEQITLPDGGVIELRRIRSAQVMPSSKHPVLMIHGIAVNHRNNDPVPKHSFARFLSERGRDVWLLTMRSGLGRPSLFGHANQAFSSMRDHDLPQAVEIVLARTQAKQLDVVAYSMGGMVLYAALGRTLSASLIRRALVFASPGMVRSLGPLAWVRYLPPFLTPTLPLRIASRSLAFAHRALPGSLKRVFYNPINVSAEIARQSMYNMFEDIPGRLGADFVRWAADGGRLTLDGAPVLDGLHDIDVPACFFAGSVDWLAPDHAVRAAYDAWGRDVPSCPKSYLLLGRSSGAKQDYGHGDFAFGTHAYEEVFEPAARFLDEEYAAGTIKAYTADTAKVRDAILQPAAVQTSST